MFVLNSASDCNCQLLNWFWQYCGSPSQGRQPQAQRSADHWTLRAKPWAHAQHLSLDHQTFSYIPVKHIPVPRQWKHRDNWTLGMHGVAISSSRMLAFDRWHPQTQISALMTKNKSIELSFSAQRANNRVQCLGTTIPFITFIPLLSDYTTLGCSRSTWTTQSCCDGIECLIHLLSTSCSDLLWLDDCERACEPPWITMHHWLFLELE